MKLIYRLVLFVYHFAAHLAAFSNQKAKQWVNGRKGLLRHVEKTLDPGEQKIWIHCPSLGEFEQGRPVIENLRKSFPAVKIVLTFYSPSGFEIRKNYKGADYVFYLPTDSPENARRWVKAVNPALAVFVKYDFWLYYLQALRSHGTKTILLSGIFRENQHFFGAFPQLGKAMLNCFDHFFVQNTASEKLLKKAGYQAVTMSGDTRFDRVWQLVEDAEDVLFAQTFKGNGKLVVAGSTWPADMQHLLKVIHQSGVEYKWIIAPHQIEDESLRKTEKQIKVSTVRLSEANDELLKSSRVLIVDEIGLLSKIYRYGDIAYVGGGFGKSIHNLLEPAAWGIPVIFGPEHQKFAEAKDLADLGGGFPVTDGTSLEHTFNQLMENEALRLASGKICAEYVKQNSGATRCVMQWLEAQQLFRANGHRS